jgi:hypothetical protein
MIGGLCARRGGAHEWRTADPSPSLGMTKERVMVDKERLPDRGLSRLNWTSLAELSPGRQSWVDHAGWVSPAGTDEKYAAT